MPKNKEQEITKEQIGISEVEEQLYNLISGGTVDDLLDMYKLLCHPTARFVNPGCDDFTVEYELYD